jgi:tetratricopeptide (TPR) repeat protein
VVERLTRPADEVRESFAGRQGAEDEATLPEVPPFGSSPPAPATTEELIAEAKQMADQLVESFPDHCQAIFLAGRIQEAFGNSAKAVDWWERCLKLDPQFSEARAALGAAAWQRGDFEKAVTHLETATAAAPRLLRENIFCLADSLMNLGRAKEAVAVLENATRISPLSANGLLVLGQAWLQLKDYAKAKERFEAALAAEPRLAGAHYGLATALSHLGQSEAAQKHREEYAKRSREDLAIWDRAHGAGRKSEKVDPAQVRGIVAGFCVGVGRVYALCGRADRAETCWLRALAIQPQSREAREHLESLYRQLGRMGP